MRPLLWEPLGRLLAVLCRNSHRTLRQPALPFHNLDNRALDLTFHSGGRRSWVYEMYSSELEIIAERHEALFNRELS